MLGEKRADILIDYHSICFSYSDAIEVRLTGRFDQIDKSRKSSKRKKKSYIWDENVLNDNQINKKHCI